MSTAQGRMYKFCWFMVRHRLAVLLVVLAFTLLFLSGIPKIKSDVILGEMFPYDHPYLKLHAKFASVFGTGATSAVIAVKTKKGDIFNPTTLKKIKDMTYEVEMWNETYRILTNSMSSRAVKVAKPKARGEISFEALMWPAVPETEEGLETLKSNIYSSPDLNGILVSEDGTAAIIATMFKEEISYAEAFGLLRGLQTQYSDENTSIHIIGFPMLMGWMHSFGTQMRVVFGVTVALMILILFLIFRNLTGMIAPIGVGLISTVIGLGFVGFTGFNFSPLLYVLAFLVGARKISHSVQITHRYFEELYASGNDKNQACFETMRAMIIPNVAGVLTDAAGFLVLILAKILLMNHIAIFMSFWMLSIAFSAILTPIICSFIPLTAASEAYSKKKTHLGVWDRINTALAGFSMGGGRYFLIGGIAVLLAFCGWQATKLKIGDPSPGSSLLWPDHPYNQAQGLINRMFKMSSDNLALYYEGTRESIFDPEVLLTFEMFDEHMAETLPDIYKSSSSIAGMARTVRLIFRDGDQAYYQLPRKEQELTGLLGFMLRKTSKTQLRRFMDVPEPSKRAQISLFFADHTSDNMLRVRNAAYDFFKTNPMETKNGKFLLAGGRIGLEIALNEEMKRSHLLIDGMVLLTIFVMCSLCFRSFLAGIMLTVPLILANLGAFAYMCLMDIGLSVNTLPVAAVGVGIGVDFAIYLYSRCAEEYPNYNDWRETILVSVSTCGKAIVYTGLTLVLAILPWYFLCDMKFQAQMGFFLSMLLFINVILALTLHPFLILIIKPKFIKKHAKANQLIGEG